MGSYSSILWPREASTGSRVQWKGFPRPRGQGKPQTGHPFGLLRGRFNPPPASRPGETLRAGKIPANVKRFQSAPGLATEGNSRPGKLYGHRNLNGLNRGPGQFVGGR